MLGIADPGSKPEFEAEVAAYAEAVPEAPGDHALCSAQAIALGNLAGALARTGERSLAEARIGEARIGEARIGEAVEILRGPVRDYPSVLLYRRLLAMTLRSRAVQFRDRGDPKRALPSAEEAVSVIRATLALAPADAQFGDAAERHYGTLMTVLHRLGDHRQIVSRAAEFAELMGARSPCLSGAPEEAREATQREALALMQRAVRAGFRDPSMAAHPAFTPFHGRPEFGRMRRAAVAGRPAAVFSRGGCPAAGARGVRPRGRSIGRLRPGTPSMSNTIHRYVTPRRTLLGAAAALCALACAPPAQSLFDGSLQLMHNPANGTLQNTLTSKTGTTWYKIVPGSFGGSWHTDLVCYARTQGVVTVFHNDGTGKMVAVNTKTTWRKTYDQVIPGVFDGKGFTDLLVYDRSRRDASFVTLDGSGNMTLLRSHTGWKDWDIVLPAKLNSDSNTDLVFFSTVRGELQLYSTDTTGQIALLFKMGTSRIWDDLVAGDFTGDGYTDLLFYSKVIGRLMLYQWVPNSGLRFVRSYDVGGHWDKIVPLFSGSSTDLVIYDRRAGTSNIGRFGAGSSLSLTRTQSVSKSWYDIVPGFFDADGTQDVLCYDNTFTLRIHALTCEDYNGARKGSITASSVKTYVDAANEIYADAGIRFEFDPESDFELAKDTVLNNLDASTAFPNETEHKKVVAQAMAYANRCPGKITVIFRHGNGTSPSNYGFSSHKARYIVMPNHMAWQAAYYLDTTNPKHGKSRLMDHLLAHELGHYLGIAHTFTSVDIQSNYPHDEVIAFMRKYNLKTLEDIDGDRTYKLDDAGRLAHIWDTPPDLSVTYYVNSGWNPANRWQETRLYSPPDGINFSFNPDRYNVMSYWPVCDDYRRFSPDQIRLMREWLMEPTRIALLTSFVGGFASYGTGCGSPKLTLRGGGCPVIGKAFYLRYSDAPAMRDGILALGVNKTNIDLGFLNAPGCSLYCDMFAMIRFRALSTTGDLPISLPNTSSLLRNTFYTQVAIIDPAANGMGLLTSNGVAVTIGN